MSPSKRKQKRINHWTYRVLDTSTEDEQRYALAECYFYDLEENEPAGYVELSGVSASTVDDLYDSLTKMLWRTGLAMTGAKCHRVLTPAFFEPEVPQ